MIFFSIHFVHFSFIFNDKLRDYRPAVLSYELENLCMKHEEFMEDLEINSEIILPQVLIIVKRLSDMNYAVKTNGDAAHAQHNLFTLLNVEYDSKIVPKENYKKIGDSIEESIKSKKYPIKYFEKYSLDELRGRLNEFKNETVKESSARHFKHKLILQLFTLFKMRR